MKLYQISTLIDQRKNNTQAVKNSYNSYQTFKKAAGGEDFIEISIEAKEKFNKDNTLKLERIIQKKDAIKLLNTINNNELINKTIESISERRIYNAKESIKDGTLNFKSNKILLKTAETLVNQLL